MLPALRQKYTMVHSSLGDARPHSHAKWLFGYYGYEMNLCAARVPATDILLEPQTHRSDLMDAPHRPLPKPADIPHRISLPLREPGSNRMYSDSSFSAQYALIARIVIRHVRDCRAVQHSINRFGPSTVIPAYAAWHSLFAIETRDSDTSFPRNDPCSKRSYWCKALQASATACHF